jgi:hypothetical protein
MRRSIPIPVSTRTTGARAIGMLLARRSPDVAVGSHLTCSESQTVWLADVIFLLVSGDWANCLVVGNKARDTRKRHRSHCTEPKLRSNPAARRTRVYSQMLLHSCSEKGEPGRASPDCCLTPLRRGCATCWTFSSCAGRVIWACCRNARTGRVGARISKVPKTLARSRTKKTLACRIAGQQETVVLPSGADRSSATVVGRIGIDKWISMRCKFWA